MFVLKATASKLIRLVSHVHCESFFTRIDFIMDKRPDISSDIDKLMADEKTSLSRIKKRDVSKILSFSGSARHHSKHVNVSIGCVLINIKLSN